jgi:hypothetical protein
MQGKLGGTIVQIGDRKCAATDNRQNHSNAQQKAAVLCVKSVLQARDPQKKDWLQGISSAVG